MSEYRKIIVETYKYSGGGSSSSIRARPVSGQGLDTSMNVECSSKMRKNSPIGSIIMLDAKVTDREGGAIFIFTL